MGTIGVAKNFSWMKLKKTEDDTMTEKEMNGLLVLLLEQENELKQIFKKRKEIKQKCLDAGGYELYNKMYKMLYEDGKSHWEF